MNLHEQYLLMARYHRWACRRLLTTLELLPEERYRQECGLFFHSIHGTLNHLVVADRLWYGRFSGSPVTGLRLDTEVCADRRALADQLIEHAQRWTDMIEGLDAAAFDSVLNYHDTRGHARSLPFAPTLSHVFNHGTHHRGQISAAVSGFGLPPPEMDLVYFLVDLA